MMCQAVDFLGSSCSMHRIFRFMSFTKLGTFSARISFNTLQSHTLSACLPNTDDANSKAFVAAPPIPDAILVFNLARGK